MKYGIPLQICFNEHLERWTNEFREEALKGKIEAMVIHAKMLARGSSFNPPDVEQAVFWLQKACFSSAEASFLLGKLFYKGKKVQKDEEKAYFYYRLAASFKCKCGRMADEFHGYRITNVHSCYVFEASVQLRNLNLPEIDQLEARFQQWVSSLDLEI